MPPPAATCAECGAVRDLWASGFEVADHSVNHQQMLDWSLEQVGLPASCGSLAFRGVWDGQLLALPPPLCPGPEQCTHCASRQVREEILGGRAAVAACGIPPASIVGWRTPYLKENPAMRTVLQNNGFLYDRWAGAAPRHPCPTRCRLRAQDACRPAISCCCYTRAARDAVLSLRRPLPPCPFPP